MPECEQKEVLAAYVYGECSSEEQQRFEAHLQTCASCANEVEVFALLQGALDKAKDEPVAVDVREAASEERSPGRMPLGTAAWLGSPAVALAKEAGKQSSRWWKSRLQPAWQFAWAAAFVILVAGIVGTDVRYGDFGFRMGWWQSTDQAGADAQDTDFSSVVREVQLLIEESEQRQREELTSMASILAGAPDEQRQGDMGQVPVVDRQPMRRKPGISNDQRRQAVAKRSSSI